MKIAPIARFGAQGLERCLLETVMLTIDQKEAILRRAGTAVPAFPERNPAAHVRDHDADIEHKAAIQRWTEAIDVLYVQYAAARAAKSLRDAEQAHQADALRRAGERSNA